MADDHRHQCETRHVLALAVGSRASSDAYLELVEKRRGKEAAERLRRDAREQWVKGAKGEWGKWMEV